MATDEQRERVRTTEAAWKAADAANEAAKDGNQFNGAKQAALADARRDYDAAREAARD